MENNNTHIDSKIENAEIIEDSNTINSHNNPTSSSNLINTSSNSIRNTDLEINKLFYFEQFILMLAVYIGPFLYFKYYKKKNFIPGSNMGVKHAI